jgi:hypothetical protein
MDPQGPIIEQACFKDAQALSLHSPAGVEETGLAMAAGTDAAIEAAGLPWSAPAKDLQAPRCGKVLRDVEFQMLLQGALVLRRMARDEGPHLGKRIRLNRGALCGSSILVGPLDPELPWVGPDIIRQRHTYVGVTMTAIWIAYGVTIGAMMLVAAVAGRLRCHTIWAIFIDSRDTWSLTQFQLVLWTFIIIPVLIAIVIGRATKDPSTAWDLTVPGEIWGLLAISLGSTTLAVAIKSQKNDPADNPLGASDRVLTRADATKARISDMFAYDEGKGALTRLDVTKFQNFVFTVALAVTYLWSCLWLFAHTGNPSAITGLPAFSGVALGILGISHAGYLTGKAIPQNGTPTTDNDTMLATKKFSR